MTYNMEGRMVRVSLPDGGSEEGVVIRYYPVTEQYLVRLYDTVTAVWVPTSAAEAI